VPTELKDNQMPGNVKKKRGETNKKILKAARGKNKKRGQNGSIKSTKKRPTSKPKAIKNKKEYSTGRPTVMTDDVIRQLEEAFAMGCTDLEACFFANISKSVFYDYLKNHPEFSDRKDELKEKPVLMARKNILDALAGNDKDISKWYLERKRKDEFSPKSELDVKDIDRTPIEIKIVGKI
jgi:hypothetical protein